MSKHFVVKMFECTQKLECTQDFGSHSQVERECFEQVGFLGICGKKYPVKKGPNKIGRDPQTCNIVLNLNSVSRQHAVINVLNKKVFMLMDLDSANKTKLLGKSLMPYVPQPLKNGDMVQFGEIFGIFRLIEAEDDLPMTQALPLTQVMNIPDTPVSTKCLPKLNSATIIPESPDVSDKDDSCIIASQPKGPQLKSSNTNFIKPGKIISIQPVGGSKIDNVYWNSSNKSTSLNLDDSLCSLNDSKTSAKISEKENEVNSRNMNEMETQAFPPCVKDIDLIFEANTQVPDSPIPSSIHSANTQRPGSMTTSPSNHTANTKLPVSRTNTSPSIYTKNTQLPEAFPSPSIHSLETQIPLGENLLEVCKINEQQDMQFDLYADKDIFDANTQCFRLSPQNTKNVSPIKKPITDLQLDRSNDVVVFDEIESQSDENLESQAILSKDILIPINNRSVESGIETESQSQIALPKSFKRNMRIKSDSSTDCEDNDDDILLSQKKSKPAEEKQVNREEDLTDCEDEMIELKTDDKPKITTEALDLEDVATQVIEVLDSPAQALDFEDMLTQVISVDEKISVDSVNEKNIDLEDLPTKVLVNDNIPPKNLVKTLSISHEVEISPFKIPLKSVFKAKKRDVGITPKIKPIANIESKPTENNDEYYQCTQDLFEDLCSQRELSPEPLSKNKSSTTSGDIEVNIVNFVSTLTSQEVRDVIGIDEKVVPLKKVSSLGSDSSDLESTPKKIRPFKFMDIDLPNSQEIKTSVSLTSKAAITESSSESESELNSEDQCTPILFRNKKKKKTNRDAKRDLLKRFDVDALPSRIITRVRKPSSKIQELEGKKINESILKPKFLTEQDDDIDREIITENITRLKSKNDKSKLGKDSNKEIKESKNEDKTDLKTSSLKATNIQKESTNSNTCDVQNDKSRKMDKETHEETNKTRDKRHRNKLSPVNKSSKHVKDHILPNALEPTIKSNKTGDNAELTRAVDDKIMEPKRNTRTSGKEEKSRGPIMIEAHTINIPVKEEKKKRENKRKNKVTIPKNNSKVGTDEKSEDAKSDNLESKRPIRNTRGKKTILEHFTTEPDSKKDEKPKRTKKETKKPSPEKEIRRSNRQRTVKEKGRVREPEIKPILKKKSLHEQSTVYNLSTGLNLDTPNLKRPAEEFDALQPIPKKTRAASRATPFRKQKPCYVLFTAFPYEGVKTQLENLGAIVVTDIMQCTVLLTLNIRRTFKLLCAVGLGKPIVGPSWVQACADTNMIVDPWLYTIKDEAAEQRFKFSLHRTLTGQRGFLKGYNVSATPSVKPQASEMKLIVQCSGGTWHEGGPRWLCLSGAADRALWAGLRARGALLVTTELILCGVLRQTLDIESHQIKIQ